VDAVLPNHFKELVVISVINMNPDDYRTRMVQSFLDDRSYLVGSSDHLASSSESLSGDPFDAIVKLTKCQPLATDGRRGLFSIIANGPTKRMNIDHDKKLSLIEIE
jgi:hypothetical protein